MEGVGNTVRSGVAELFYRRGGGGLREGLGLQDPGALGTPMHHYCVAARGGVPWTIRGGGGGVRMPFGIGRMLYHRAPY